VINTDDEIQVLQRDGYQDRVIGCYDNQVWKIDPCFKRDHPDAWMAGKTLATYIVPPALLNSLSQVHHGDLTSTDSRTLMPRISCNDS
jgi:hypothetical protein